MKSLLPIAFSIEYQTAIIKGVITASSLFIITFLSSTVTGKFWFGQLIGPVIFSLGYVLASFIVALVCSYLFKWRSKLFFVLVLFAPLVVRLLQAVYGWYLAILVFSLGLTTVVCISCFVSKLTNKRTFDPLLFFFIVGFFVILITGNNSLRSTPTFNSFISDAEAMQNEKHWEFLSTPGRLSFQQLTYGSGNDNHRPEYSESVDIVTESVDGSLLLNSWKGMTSYLRELFWGFDASRLPVQGRVWLPETDEKTPLVLMVHGNHDMERFSDTGYSYLGEHLSSRGYTFVSVDQNFLNGTNAEGFYGFRPFRLHSENDARAWLLLKHLEQWREWQNDKDSILFNKVDLNKIILIGHSRGGEAAYVAALFNNMKYNPEDANLEFDFNFNILGVVSLAPSDGQYRPRGSLADIKDINFLTIQGSADGDAMVFLGASAYSRVKFTKQNDYFKSNVMIHGANHSQFNSEWGSCDKMTYVCHLATYENLIVSQQQQQKLAKQFITAYADTVTRQDKDYRSFFRQPSSKSQSDSAHYFTPNYLDSSADIIANYEGDADLSAVKRGKVASIGLSEWREVKMKHHPNWNWSDLSTHAVLLGWNNSDDVANYSINLYPESTEKECLGFSIANANDENNSSKITNLSIQLSSTNGQVGAVELVSYHNLYPSLIRKPDLYEASFVEPTFQSVQIPLSEFKLHASESKKSDIQSIKFVFDKTPSGKIYLDDIYFGDCII